MVFVFLTSLSMIISSCIHVAANGNIAFFFMADWYSIVGFPGGTVVKNLPANARDARDAGSIPGWADPLEEEMATRSSSLAWEMSWTEEPGGLQSMELKRSSRKGNGNPLQ